LSGVTLTTSWSYNKLGQVKKITHPNGMVVDYVFDGQSRIKEIKSNNSQIIKNVVYKPFGPASSLQFGSGLYRSYHRDDRYRLTGIYSYNILNLGYQYDANNNITRIDDHYSTASKKYRSHVYDSLDRVMSSQDYDVLTSYKYDANSNRTFKNSTSYSIASSSNRLLSYSNTSFSYDSNGNVTKKGSRNFAYDDANRMTSQTYAGTTAYYTYNASGQRVVKKVNGVKTWFAYDIDGKLIYERTGSTHKSYIYRGNELVGFTKNNVRYYVHSDHLGRPEVITNTANTKVWQARNKSFGRDVTLNSIGGFNLGFPGQYWDSEKSSWYNYFRDYDSTTGRYLQSDPIGLAGGINTYGYVLGNPLKYTDRLGLNPDGSCACNTGQPATQHGSPKLGDVRVQGPFTAQEALEMTQASHDRNSDQFQTAASRTGAGVAVLAYAGVLTAGTATLAGVGLWGSTELFSMVAGNTFNTGEILVTLPYTHGTHRYDVVFHYGADGKVISQITRNVPGCN
jgi:RHS repeat-associated protein